MQIKDLSKCTGIPAKTIRFYESVGLLPAPARARNNYRQYSASAVERLRYIAAARALGFRLEEVAEFLNALDMDQLPCQRVLDSLDTRLVDLDRQIADLLALLEKIIALQDGVGNLP